MRKALMMCQLQFSATTLSSHVHSGHGAGTQVCFQAGREHFMDEGQRLASLPEQVLPAPEGPRPTEGSASMHNCRQDLALPQRLV